MRSSYIPGFELVLLFVAVLTLPLYFWDSGLPQVTHLLFLLLAVVNFVVQLRPLPNHPGVRILLALTAVVFARQSVMTMAGSDAVMLPSLYLAFNFVVFITVFSYSLRNPEKVWRVVLWATLGALGLQFAAIARTGFGLYLASAIDGRSIGTLNNPNQLGYYAVLTSSLLLLFHWQRLISLPWAMALYGLTGVLAALSLSKAALLAMILMGAAFFRGWKLVLFLAFWASLPLLFPLIAENFSSLRVFQRLTTIGESGDDSLIARGYGPLLNPDWRLLLGWGEGYVEEIYQRETHSTLGNLLISYGVLGFGLFCAFMLYCYSSVAARHGTVAAMVLMLGFNLYGVAHNGIRFTSLWLLLALAMSAYRIPTAAESRSRPVSGAGGLRSVGA